MMFIIADCLQEFFCGSLLLARISIKDDLAFIVIILGHVRNGRYKDGAPTSLLISKATRPTSEYES